MILRIGRFGDHRGDEPVADAILHRFEVELPDGGGGADVGGEVSSIFGERRLSVGEERNLGEREFPETDGPGFPGIQEAAQRDGLPVRPRSGLFGNEIVGRQVAEKRHLRGGDAAVPDGVRAAGIRPARQLAARGDENDHHRKNESFCFHHSLGFE